MKTQFRVPGLLGLTGGPAKVSEKISIVYIYIFISPERQHKLKQQNHTQQFKKS